MKIGLMAISWPLWHIFARNFTQELKIIPYKPFCRQNSIPTKSKMAAAAILKFILTATTQSLLKIFAQNLAQRLKRTSQKQSYFQISLLRKSKMAAAAILKIGLMAISRIIWLTFARYFAKGLYTVCCKNHFLQKDSKAQRRLQLPATKMSRSNISNNLQYDRNYRVTRNFPRNPRWRGHHFEIQFNGHNYPVIIAYIRTKFVTASKSDVNK